MERGFFLVELFFQWPLGRVSLAEWSFLTSRNKGVVWEYEVMDFPRAGSLAAPFCSRGDYDRWLYFGDQ